MKSSAIKILQSYLNKKNVNNLKKKINKTNALIGVIIIILLSLTIFLLKPYLFEYQAKEKIIQSKISDYMKTQVNINGGIEFNVFPSPRLKLKNLEFNLDNTGKHKIIVPEGSLILSLTDFAPFIVVGSL